MNIKLCFLSLCLLVLAACSGLNSNTLDDDEVQWKEPPVELPTIPVNEKPRILWIDASANFEYLANKKENVRECLVKAKYAGFTEVVVDVRPTCGDVLYRSNIVEQIKTLKYIDRTVTWDYLGTFIEEAHNLGLKVNANMNAMSGGNIRDGGVLYRDEEKRSWATQLYYPSGIVSAMDDGKSHAKFFNPVNPEVQNYILSIIKELAQNYPGLDGIVLDRARFNSIESDFSQLTKSEFEKYIGKTIESYPYSIFTWNMDKVVPGKYYKQWLEFRAKTIYDFFSNARNTIKEVNPEIKFGTYTGSWYSSYYNEGVNWASNKYDASRYYSWATPDYKNYGYASLLDLYMTGAYGQTLYGAENEWTVEGAILNAKKVTMGDVNVCGSLYGLNYENHPENAEEAVYITLTTGDGLMFFDMVYLMMYDQWGAVKRGIDRALKSDSK
ncbi:Glycosyl hydrolase-like 10 [Mariniphaga anaerophila]|uniref:Glycosyl hydrolase-like 10 n=1 Tax=Mariniphaga anaerophila TaxID=1484053 RepID=A0A1M5ALP6_9BACT|nr:alpha amylase family protein [Mariniphaga anaerophila]SHF31169.1 Glycosyl hydrolase-like 10 [Mariniphaga anaerophila]